MIAASLSDVTTAWAHGWAAARGFPAGVEHGRVVVDVGMSERVVEAVLADAEPGAAAADATRAALGPAADADLDLDRDAALAAGAAWALGNGPAAWLTVMTTRPEPVRAHLERAGLVASPAEWLMTRGLAGHPTRVPPDGATLDCVDTEAPGGRVRTDLTVGIDGVPAAAGRVVARAGAPAVFDVISTEPAFRRRGLGAVVMAVLAGAAREQGATDGVLVASADGRALYTALGWRVVAEVVGVRTP